MVWTSKKKTANSDIIYAVVGNKCYLYNNQEVSNDEAKEFAKSINAIFALISDKSSDGVNELFYHIARKILDPDYDYIKTEKKEIEEYNNKRKKENENENINEKKEKCIICWETYD